MKASFTYLQYRVSASPNHRKRIKDIAEPYPSSASHVGQKFSLFLSQLHVFFDVPPSPCTKMMLHIGLEHV